MMDNEARVTGAVQLRTTGVFIAERPQAFDCSLDDNSGFDKTKYGTTKYGIFK